MYAANSVQSTSHDVENALRLIDRLSFVNRSKGIWYVSSRFTAYSFSTSWRTFALASS